jgi:hypothetical protein
MYCRVVKQMSTDVLEVPAASIIRAMINLMIEAARTSETSVEICLYIPEDSELHTRRRENLKSPTKGYFNGAGLSP